MLCVPWHKSIICLRGGNEKEVQVRFAIHKIILYCEHLYPWSWMYQRENILFSVDGRVKKAI